MRKPRIDGQGLLGSFMIDPPLVKSRLRGLTFIVDRVGNFQELYADSTKVVGIQNKDGVLSIGDEERERNTSIFGRICHHEDTFLGNGYVDSFSFHACTASHPTGIRSANAACVSTSSGMPRPSATL